MVTFHGIEFSLNTPLKFKKTRKIKLKIILTTNQIIISRFQKTTIAIETNKDDVEIST